MSREEKILGKIRRNIADLEGEIGLKLGGRLTETELIRRHFCRIVMPPLESFLLSGVMSGI